MRSDARKAYGRGRRPRPRGGDQMAGAALSVVAWGAAVVWLVGWTLGVW